MLEDIKKYLYEGIEKGLINEDHRVINDDYEPKFVINDQSNNVKVISTIQKELKNCEEFIFVVAFITEGGVQSIMGSLEEAKKRGVKGTIIASQYLNFSDPSALKKLMKFDNIDLRIIPEENAKVHTKGYIFRRDNQYNIIIGSSNLTQSALSVNKEWNVKFVSLDSGSIAKNLKVEIEEMRKLSIKVTDQWLNDYSQIYYSAKKLSGDYLQSDSVSVPTPNSMQIEALEYLEDLRNSGAGNKALIVSATGTGKTYLSAFDVKNFNPRKCLFIVHREVIANDAKETFEKVFGGKKRMGLLKSGHRANEDFVFAMVQTLTKDKYLERYRRDEFDYIIIDEVHRSAAKTYRKILEYFNPKFLLGMSATPDRTDGQNIYEIFDHNVAVDIRLQDALLYELVCPFHYYGVSDLFVEGEAIDDKTSFNRLIEDERVKHIDETVRRFGYSGDRVKGLIFCSRNEEAEELSRKLNLMGYRTLALSGSDSNETREYAIERLEQNEDNEHALDYILTVDIFNEGVDIPSINQIVMLRPTQSTIIFIQQLGRGLRKTKNKEFVVVIDIIGNYSNNFMIPIALTGDRTYNKDDLRKVINDGNSSIPGASTIYLEEVVKERIFESIDNATLGDVRQLKNEYMRLKNRLGKIPSIKEFNKYSAIDISKIFSNANIASYYKFQKKYDSEYDIRLNESEELYMEFFSRRYASGIRPHELELVKLIVEGKYNSINDFKELMKIKYPEINITQNTINNLLAQMTQEYDVGLGKDKYKEAMVLFNHYTISENLRKALANKDFSQMLLEVIEVGLLRNQEKHSKRYKSGSFCLYNKYTYDDVVRLLDWEKNEVALNIGGYKYHNDTKTFPVFITYDKEDNISDSIDYHDRFTSKSSIIAMSKSGRTKSSPEIERLMNKYMGKKSFIIPLFVKKNKSQEFYYLGEMNPTGFFKEENMKSGSSVVEIGYELETPIKQDVYDYLIG